MRAIITQGEHNALTSMTHIPGKQNKGHFRFSYDQIKKVITFVGLLNVTML